jgi:hypothetical protein
LNLVAVCLVLIDPPVAHIFGALFLQDRMRDSEISSSVPYR